MNNYLKIFIISVIGLSLAGCISTVNVKKFTGEEKGIRYSLPSTYVLVSPKADGTANYEWVFLPDPENEYVVQTRSFMSKYTTDLTLENNMLKKVSTKSDSTGVAAKMLDSAQSVYSAKLTAAADAAKAAKEAANKEADKTTALQKALTDAELELKLANIEKQTLYDNRATFEVTKAQLLAAEIKVAQAVAKRDAAQTALNSSQGAMNAPTPLTLSSDQAWGPLLFKVVQTRDNVSLIAVNIQGGFDTGSSVTPTKPPPGQTLNIKGSKVFAAIAPKALKFEVVASQIIDKVDDKSLTIIKNLTPFAKSKVSVTLQPDKKTIVVDISPCPPKGDYTMTIPYSTAPGEELKADVPVEFTVK